MHRKRVAITTPFFRHWARICTKQRLESTRIRWMTRWRHRQTLDIAFSGWKRYSNVMIGGRLYESQAKTGKLKEVFSHWKRRTGIFSGIRSGQHDRRLRYVFLHWRQFVEMKKVRFQMESCLTPRDFGCATKQFAGGGESVYWSALSAVGPGERQRRWQVANLFLIPSFRAGKATFLELLLYGWKNCNGMSLLPGEGRCR